MDYRGWNPTSMPRRESQHAFLHPRYDGGPQAQTEPAQPSARIVEERMIGKEASVSVDPEQQD